MRIFTYIAAVFLVCGCEGAPQAPTPEAPPVVRIWMGGSHYCSGVLASERSVLTAAHCVREFPAADLRVKVAGAWFAATHAAAHPEWAPGLIPSDIGLIVLSEAPRGVTPAHVAAAEISPGAGLLAWGMAGGDLHSESFTVKARRDTSLYLQTDSGGLCRGDSGGPQLSGGALIALNTRGDCAGNAVGELIAPHLEWLISQGF